MRGSQFSGQLSEANVINVNYARGRGGAWSGDRRIESESVSESLVLFLIAVNLLPHLQQRSVTLGHDHDENQTK